MYAQQQYQIDAQRRREIQECAKREQQAIECQRQSNRNMFTTITQWVSYQFNQRPADQMQTNRQVIIRSA